MSRHLPILRMITGFRKFVNLAKMRLVIRYDSLPEAIPRILESLVYIVAALNTTHGNIRLSMITQGKPGMATNAYTVAVRICRVVFTAV